MGYKIGIVGNGTFSLAKRLFAEGNRLFFTASDEDPGTVFGDRISEDRLSDTDFVIVVDVEPCITGLVESLRVRGVPVFGCGVSGTVLETDRSFASALCDSVGVPTPRWASFSDKDEGLKFIRGEKKSFVLKKDDLVRDRGVMVCDTVEELKYLLHDENFGQDASFILQEKVNGVEVCFHAVIVEGGRAVPILTDFEYKRAYDGDLGPLAGPMGQIVLAGVSSRGLDLYRRVAPYLNEIDYGGFLQISTIYDPEEEVFRFLEFTPRFGTPGSDVMLRLYEGRWTDLFYAWARREWVRFEPSHACGASLVLAGAGYPYPNQVMQGLPIRFKGVDPMRDPGIDLMNVSVRGNKFFTKGGRHVLAFGYGATVEEACGLLYENAEKVQFLDMWYRTDVGKRWYDRERSICVEHGIAEEGMGGFSGWETR